MNFVTLPLPDDAIAINSTSSSSATPTIVSAGKPTRTLVVILRFRQI